MWLTGLLVLLTIGQAFATSRPVEFYPSPSGNDQWSGRPADASDGKQQEGPFRSLPIFEVQHGRNSRLVNGKPAPCPLWLTEMGLHPQEHAGVTDRDAAMRLKARTTARSPVSSWGKASNGCTSSPP